MYAFDWDVETGAYRLTTQTGKYVANEIRPVFAEELVLTGMNKRFKFDEKEKRPFLWARKNVYLLNGEKVAQLNGVQYGKPLSVEYFFDEKRRKLQPVDVEEAIKRNAPIMTHVVADAKRRIKELYDLGAKRSDVAYIAFSGGKDSVVLLDLCSRVLPPSAPVWSFRTPTTSGTKFKRGTRNASLLKSRRAFRRWIIGEFSGRRRVLSVGVARFAKALRRSRI